MIKGITKKKLIKELVKAINAKKPPQNKVINLGKISDAQAQIIKIKTGLNLVGYERVLDKSGILHSLKSHGDASKEKLRGQIAITEKDFELIPLIVKTKNIIFTGKNKRGLNCILYEQKIGFTYYYVEEVRTKNKKLAINTMYKRK